VISAIWKEPADGRVVFGDVNLAGDDQADRRVHGGPDKAVYAYAAEDYDWWHSDLGRPLAPGTFGENLTTVGLDLQSAVLGERWAVGAGTMRVAQPRQPCFKLGMRMGDAGFPERFEASRRFGAYLRVDQPGDVGAGDDLQLLSRPDHGVTVAMVAEAAATRSPDIVAALLEAGTDLPEGWRTWAERQRERAAPRRRT